MKTLAIKWEAEQLKRIKKILSDNRCSFSKFVREAVLQKIENEFSIDLNKKKGVEYGSHGRRD